MGVHAWESQGVERWLAWRPLQPWAVCGRASRRALPAHAAMKAARLVVFLVVVVIVVTDVVVIIVAVVVVIVVAAQPGLGEQRCGR